MSLMNCSPAPFFNNVFDPSISNQPHIQRAKVLLSAMEEVVSSEKSSVSYFGAILSTLEQCTGKHKKEKDSVQPRQTNENLESLLYLLSLVSPHIPDKIFKSRSKIISELYMTLFDSRLGHSVHLSKYWILTVAHFLSTIKTDHWKPFHTRLFLCFLSLSMDERPNVRKTAQHSIVSLTKEFSSSNGNKEKEKESTDENNNKMPERLAIEIREYILKLLQDFQFKSYSKDTNDWKPSLFLLAGYFKYTCAYLPFTLVTFPIMEASLGLCRTLVPKTLPYGWASTIFTCMKMLFTEGPMDVYSEEGFKLFNSFFDLKNLGFSHNTDTKTQLSFINSMTAVFVRMMVHNGVPENPDLDKNLIEKSFSYYFIHLIDMLLSNDVYMIRGVTDTLKILISFCLPTLMDKKKEAMTDLKKPTLFDEILVTIEDSFTSPKFSTSKHLIAELISTLVGLYPDHIKYDNISILLSFVEKLVFARDEVVSDRNVSPLIINALSTAIGNTIEILGPELVLKIAPLNLFDRNNNNPDKKTREWLLLVLKSHIKFGSIDYWTNQLLPISNIFIEKARQCDRMVLGKSSKIIETNKLDIMSLDNNEIENSIDQKDYDDMKDDLSISDIESDVFDNESEDKPKNKNKRSLNDISEKKYKKIKESNDPTQALSQDDEARSVSRSCKEIVKKIWALLPRFCLCITDTSTVLDKNIKTIFTYFNGPKNDYCISPICRAIINMVQSTKIIFDDNLPHKLMVSSIEMSSILEKIVPSLFQVLKSNVNKSSIRDPIISTITITSTILSSEFINIQYDKLISNIDMNIEGQKEKKEKKDRNSDLLYIFDILFALACRFNDKNIESVYKIVESHIVKLKDSSYSVKNNSDEIFILKKSFNILAEIIRYHSDFLSKNLFCIISLLQIQSKYTPKKNRLHCIQRIFENWPDSKKDDLIDDKDNCLSVFLRDAIMSTKELGERRRERAFQLIFTLSKSLISLMDNDTQALEFLFDKLINGVKQENLNCCMPESQISKNFKNGSILALSKLLKIYHKQLTPHYLDSIRNFVLYLNDKASTTLKQTLSNLDGSDNKN